MGHFVTILVRRRNVTYVPGAETPFASVIVLHRTIVRETIL